MTPAPNTPEPTLLAAGTMWLAGVASIGVFYILTKSLLELNPVPNLRLVWLTLGIAIYEVFLSVYWRARLRARARKTLSLTTARGGYLLAFMACESAAVFGLVAFLIAGWPRYWILFLIGLAGFVLNIPRREDFEPPRTP